MAVHAWLVAPAIADGLSGEANVPLVKALTASLTAGLVWQLSSSRAWLPVRSGRCAGRWCARRCGCSRRVARAAAGAAGAAGGCGCC
jgi:hypothetical protein